MSGIEVIAIGISVASTAISAINVGKESYKFASWLKKKYEKKEIDDEPWQWIDYDDEYVRIEKKH
tara:strand:- start:318 stop:512 length:195 start_codon:yes stop_codon:yes gene_type:complete